MSMVQKPIQTIAGLKAEPADCITTSLGVELDEQCR